ATGETGTDGLLISSAASGVSFQNYENAPMQFGSGGAAIQMTLSQAGNLGLKTGVSTPFNKLSIDGNASIGTNYYSLTAAANSLIVEGKIGIGVVNPDSPLQVEQTNNWAEGKFYTYHTGGTNYSAIILGRANGTQTIPTATQASNILGAVVFRGAHGAGIWQVEASQIYALAEENFASATNGGASILFSTVAIGTSVSSERMRLFHNGNLGIGATAPPSLLTVGSGNQFQINATGNILRINSVATNFPNAQGGANTFLRNDGGGNLSWVVSGGISQWTTSGSNIYYNTGNVGIGTSIPGVRLDVVGTTNIQAGKITKDGFDWLDGQPGNRNYFIGQAGNLGITGTDNFLVGSFAGNAMTTGFDNTFIGRQAGRTNTTGRSNFFVGTLSGFTNLSGNRNIFIGEGTGFTNSTGTQNIYMGWQTGFFNLGSSNIYMGSQAGYGAVGSNNTNNIGFGPAALYSITSGAANIVLGYQAAFSLTTGIANIAIGSNSGSNFGTSNNNIAIGTNADVISPASNGIAIGTGASVTTSNTMVIAPSITAVGIGTATPKTKLDVDGDVAFRLKTYTATNGANNNIVLPAGATYVKIIGPAAVFNISGIAGGQDGKLVILHNATTSNMTINHQITSTAANRIITNTGADLVTTGEGMAILIYDNLSFRWIVLAFTP
ncbi:MAG: beta strand repeat-containing protein, partial [Cytophagales bacterium]